MASTAQDTREKVYIIRGEGAPEFLKILDRINQRFKDLKKAKQDLDGTRGSIADAGELQRVNDQLEKITKQESELGAERQKLLESARQEIATNREAVGTYNDVTASVNTSAQAQEKLAAATKEATAAIEAQAAAKTGPTFQESYTGRDDTLPEAEAAAAHEREAQALRDEASAAQEATNYYAELAAAKLRELEANGEALGSTEALSAAEEAALTPLEQLYSRNIALSAMVKELNAELKELSAAWEAGTITEEDYEAATIRLTEGLAYTKAELAESNNEIKVQIALQLANANSINAWRAAVRELTLERNNLNLSTEEGKARQLELNTAIDEYNTLIRENADAYLKQKINIGNYPTATAELRALKVEMEQLVLAGQKDSEAFAQMSARARELSLTLGQVREATSATATATTTSAERIGAFAERAVSLENVAKRLITSFTRMGIHFLAFTLIAKGIEYVVEKLTNTGKEADKAAKALEKYKNTLKSIADSEQNTAQAEIAHANVLAAVAANTEESMKNRLRAVAELQKTYPDYFGNLSKEAILQGNVTDAINKTTQALIARAAATAAEKKFAAAGEKLYDLELSRREAEKKLANARKEYNGGKQDTYMYTHIDRVRKNNYEDAVKAYDKITDAIATARAEQEGFITDAKTYAAQAGQTIFGPDPKEKKVRVPKVKPIRDAAAAEYKGEKELNDAIAKLRQDQIEADVQANEEIYQDDKKTLAERLLAYQNYSSDREYQAEQERDRTVANAKDELEKIKTQLATFAANQKKGIKGPATSPELYNSLIAQQKAANVKIQDADEELAAKRAEIARKGAKDIQGIINSDTDVRLRAIDEIKEKSAEALETDLATLRKRHLTVAQYTILETKLKDQAHIRELEQIKEYLTVQIAANEAAGLDATKYRKLLAQTNRELSAANTKLADDTKKHTFDLEKFYKELENTALDTAKTIADGFIAEEQRKIDKDIQARESALDTQKQTALAAAQSAAERAAIEKEYDQKQTALQKEAFDRKKKLSEAELAIDFAVASIKAVSQALDVPGAGIFEALAAEALVALEYAGKLAVLEAQQFGAGGEVPVDGGELKGRPHSRGGTNLVFRGTPVNAEAEELLILNKRSAKSGVRYTVSGTSKQIASALNSAGGGVSFAPGASIARYEYGGSLGASLPSPYLTSFSSGAMDMEALNAFIAATARGFRETHGRIDELKVTLNPQDVARSNDRHKKNVALGKL